MPYVVKWKDGSSTQMEDKEFENLPSDMEADIGSIQQTPSTPTPFNPPMVKQEESSPFGARPPQQPLPAKPPTLGDVAYDYYGRPAVAVGNFVRNNPAKSALAAGTLLTGGMDLLPAAGLAMGAEVIDKFHPFNKDIRSEYESKTPAQNIEDVGTAGMWGAAGQKVSNVTSGLADRSRLTSLQQALDAEGRQGAILEAERLAKLNQAKEASNAIITKAHANLAANYQPSELTPDFAKFIRKQMIAENVANGVPKRIVTNRDIQDRFIKMNQDLRETVAVPHPRELLNPSPIPEIPPERTSDFFKGEDLTRVVIGAGLGTHLGPLGTIGGGVLGGFARPVSDAVVNYAAKKVPQLAAPVLQGISKSAYPMSTGLGIPVTKGIVDLLRGNSKK